MRRSLGFSNLGMRSAGGNDKPDPMFVKHGLQERAERLHVRKTWSQLAAYSYGSSLGWVHTGLFKIIDGSDGVALLIDIEGPGVGRHGFH